MYETSYYDVIYTRGTLLYVDIMDLETRHNSVNKGKNDKLI